MVRKSLCEKMGADGHWHPTKLGLEYFKYNRDLYDVEYPVRLARPVDNGKPNKVKRMEWVLDHPTFDYKRHPEQNFTVGQIKESGRLALGSNKEAHIRDAAHQFILTQTPIRSKDPDTGKTETYYPVMYDSPFWYVWDPTRPIKVTAVRRHLYDRSRPTADEILERPMRHFFVVPDGCYRPWDLHPLSLAKDGRCTVTMIRECFLKRHGRQHSYRPVMDDEAIESQLEHIFQELGYEDNEYPFEQGWRHDGCTSKMILEFCRLHDIICHIYHDSIRKENEVACHVPAKRSSHTPQMNFFIRDDHCYWYGKPCTERGISEASDANNGISHMWQTPHSADTDDDEDEDYFANLCDKETAKFFQRSNMAPPFAEWKHASKLLDAAPDFGIFHEPPKKLWSHGKRKKLYFWHANLRILEPHLRKRLEPGQVECKYGPSPDKPTTLLAHAANCPLFVVRQVPVECELFQDIFNKATDV